MVHSKNKNIYQFFASLIRQSFSLLIKSPSLTIFFISCSIRSSIESRFIVGLQIIVSFHLRISVDSHEQISVRLFTLINSEAFPGAAGDTVEGFLFNCSYGFRVVSP